MSIEGGVEILVGEAEINNAYAMTVHSCADEHILGLQVTVNIVSVMNVFEV